MSEVSNNIFSAITGGTIKMLSDLTLKNINIYDFQDFFTVYKVNRRSVRIQASSTPNKYIRISEMLNDELSSGTSFSNSQLDDFIFEKLFYANNDHHYIYKFDNFFANNSTSVSEAEQYLSGFPELYLNDLTNNNIDVSKKYNICTTRVEGNDTGKVKAVHILIRIATIELTHGDTHIFAGVTIDLESGFVLFKFGLNEFVELPEDPLKIVDGIKQMLNGEGTTGKIVTPLKLNITSLNEQEPKEAIFYLFEEMSREAEDLLNARVSPDAVDKIKNFLLNEMGLHHVTDDYIEQIKAVIYQDISSTIDTTLFKDGWVFRFHYREGDHTRATSKQEDRGPIYSSKTFWQLKELIYKEKEMLEAGFHWYLVDNTKIEDFVDVRLIAQNDTMIVHYYFKNRHGRKEKEEFVLRKTAKYLS